VQERRCQGRLETLGWFLLEVAKYIDLIGSRSFTVDGSMWRDTGKRRMVQGQVANGNRNFGLRVRCVKLDAILL
jgi:hypothetical protein